MSLRPVYINCAVGDPNTYRHRSFFSRCLSLSLALSPFPFSLFSFLLSRPINRRQPYCPYQPTSTHVNQGADLPTDFLDGLYASIKAEKVRRGSKTEDNKRRCNKCHSALSSFCALLSRSSVSPPVLPPVPPPLPPLPHHLSPTSLPPFRPSPTSHPPLTHLSPPPSPVPYRST